MTSLFHVGICLKGRIKFGTKESEEEIQEVYTQGIGNCAKPLLARYIRFVLKTPVEHTNVPSLRHDDSEHEHQQHECRARPAIRSERCRPVKVGLIYLQFHISVTCPVRIASECSFFFSCSSAQSRADGVNTYPSILCRLRAHRGEGSVGFWRVHFVCVTVAGAATILSCVG